MLPSEFVEVDMSGRKDSLLAVILQNCLRSKYLETSRKASENTAFLRESRDKSTKSHEKVKVLHAYRCVLVFLLYLCSKINLVL